MGLNGGIDIFIFSLTTHELIDILEEDTEFSEAHICIFSPDNQWQSEEDSGYKCESDINHLSGTQLRSIAEATISKYVDGEIVRQEVRIM